MAEDDGRRDAETEKLSSKEADLLRMAAAVEMREALSNISGDLIDGRYRVLKAMRPGGQADVYLCDDDGRSVVVKIYRMPNFTPKEDVIRLRLDLHHDNVVTTLGHGTWDGRFYEVMEYAAGGSLADHMPIKEQDLIDFVVPQVASALEYCHSNNFLHRDIKPSNLFYRDATKKTVLVGDFGIAAVRPAGVSLMTLEQMGLSIEYSAREVFTRHPVPKSDYYALGISLMVLLTGQSPFSGMEDNPHRIWHIHDSDSEIIEPPSCCSELMQALIEWLLIKDYTKRGGKEQIRDFLTGVLRRPQRVVTRFYCELGDGLGLAAHSPEELGKLMLEHPEIAKPEVARDILHRHVDKYDQRLAWRILQIKERAANPDLAYIEIVYTLNKDLPYRLTEAHGVHSPAQLVAAVDSDPQAWAAAREQLSNGLLLAWLRGIGQEELVKEWAGTEKLFVRQPDACLEAFLHRIDPALPFPGVVIDPPQVNLASVEQGGRRTMTVTVSGAGRGFLSGSVEVQGDARGIAISSDRVAAHSLTGEKAVIGVTFDAADISPGRAYNASLIFNTNAGGEAQLPISFRTVFPFTAVLRECLRCGAIGALAAVVVRALMSLGGHWNWLKLDFSHYIGVEETWRRFTVHNFGQRTEFLIAFLAVITAVVIWLRRRSRRT